MALSRRQRLTNQEAIAVGCRVEAFKIVNEYSHKKKFTRNGLQALRQEMLVRLLELFGNQFHLERASESFHRKALEQSEEVDGVKPLRKLEKVLKWVLGIAAGVVCVGVAGIGVAVGGVLVFSVPFGGLLLGGTIAAGSVALAGAGFAIGSGIAKSKLDYVAEGRITSRMGEVLIYTMIALSKRILVDDLEEKHILAYTTMMAQKLENPNGGIPVLSAPPVPVASTTHPSTPTSTDSFTEMADLDPPPKPNGLEAKEIDPWMAVSHPESALVVTSLRNPPQPPSPE